MSEIIRPNEGGKRIIDHNKLVRDKIPQCIENDGKNPDTRILDKEEYREALREKIGEEARELQNAKTPEDIRDELADLLELIDATARAEGLDIEDIKAHKVAKLQERGGFEKGIFLESVTEHLD